MSKLMIALIAGTFAATAAAQTGVLNPAASGDHGTTAMHAAEAKKNVDASKAVKGLTPDARTRQQVAKDVTTGGAWSSASSAASAKGAAVAKAGAAESKALPTKADKQMAVKVTTAKAAKEGK